MPRRGREWGGDHLVVRHRVEFICRGVGELGLAEVNLRADQDGGDVFDVVINLRVPLVLHRLKR